MWLALQDLEPLVSRFLPWAAGTLNFCSRVPSRGPIVLSTRQMAGSSTTKSYAAAGHVRLSCSRQSANHTMPVSYYVSIVYAAVALPAAAPQLSQPLGLPCATYCRGAAS